jgi:hypothetical protein
VKQGNNRCLQQIIFIVNEPGELKQVGTGTPAVLAFGGGGAHEVGPEA